MRQNRNNDALIAFRKASALDQQDTVSLCMVGYTLEEMGHSQEAIKCYAQALKMKPGDVMASKLLASIDLKD